MNSLFLLLLYNISTTLCLKIALSLSKGDFCVMKKVSLGDEVTVIANVSSPINKNKVNFLLYNDAKNELIFIKNQISELNEIINAKGNLVYKFCFKPIYEEDVFVDFSIFTATETNEAHSLAGESTFLI